MKRLFKILGQFARNQKRAFVLFGYLFGVLISCIDFVEVDYPRTEVARKDVFNNDVSATAALLGIYSDMFVNSGTFGVVARTGLSSDELVDFEGGQNGEFYDNSLSPMNLDVAFMWTEFYHHIYSANALIEGLAKSTGVTPNAKRQLEGEAKFIRAWCYFYLGNLWSDVPLVTTTDYRLNTNASRTPLSEIYQQTVNDLKEAIELLPDGYEFSNGERGRPNRSAAASLLARTYLYSEDWVKAEEYATMVIDRVADYSLLSNLEEIFLVNSLESIWQLRSTEDLNGGVNTWFGEEFILETAPVRFSLSEYLVSSFEEGDLRKASWVGEITEDDLTYYYPFKYKIRAAGDVPPITEAENVLRLSELYLIRSEARARLGNLVGAQLDLNAIRGRAGLPDINTNDLESLLSAIEQERKVELFTEGGHRWLDLKRTKKANLVLSKTKLNWQSTDQLYPLPQSELDKAPNLKPQNPGY